MSCEDKVIENPLYSGMSLKTLLESADLFEIPWADLKGDEGKSGKDGEEKKEGGEWEQYNAGAAFLGPTLWDKTLSYDSDLKVSLEYMDLDEFLNENGIPIDESVKRPAAQAAGTGGSSNATTPGLGGSVNMGPIMSPETPSSPESSPSRVGSGMGVAGGPQTPAPMGHAAAPITVLPPALSPQECSLEGYPSSPESSSCDPHDPLQVHEPVPGQDFDPRTRSFTEDELKPQPMIKKSRKQFVPSELKDDKYWARRRKNNLAAKRSRDARRLKENQIAMRANFLEKENSVLSAELQKAQSMVESLKKRLAMYETV